MRYLFLIIVAVFLSCQRGEVTNYTPYLNHNDTVRYVGKEQCRMCHAEIYDSYMQTGMGKSLNYATKEHSSLTNSDMPIIYDEINNLSYQPFWKNDSLYLKEFRVKGKDTTHLLIKKVDYKIGSGHHTNSHLFEINGYIHQMPYTYYTQDDIADLPPGFENGNNTRFSRKIGLECMSCHNAYTDHQEGSFNKYNVVPKGIDCERCHGPGEVHVQQKLAGNIIDTSRYIDYSIVNPSRLPIDLQFDVCQRCHLQGTAVLTNGSGFNDFKPGKPLTDFMDVYLPKYKGDESFIMASHVDRLKQSACFQNADITCITCHNPHKSVNTLEANYFDNKCMECHDVCKEEEPQNCISCHMPNSSSTDIMHVSITDHKIGVHNKFKKKKGDFIGLMSINNDRPTYLSKAKAYLKHYESFEANFIYLDSSKYYLDKLSIEESFFLYVQYYYLKKQYKEVINLDMKYDNQEYFGSSNEEKALCLSRIAESYSLNDIDIKALSYYQRANSLYPYSLDIKIKLGVQFLKMKNFSQAKQEFMDVFKKHPEYKEAYCNLGYLAILDNDFQLAEEYLNKAIDLDPDYLQAYENLVLSSQRQNKIDQVKVYLNKILEIAPNHRAKEILQKL
mgnify:CR=1 FL=1|tara:strand:- start:77 stop:1924 length:1848 start_codon:yes stop_codon:yes gene_type:complete